MGFTYEGLRPANCLAAKFMILTRQYRFDRLSTTHVLRTNLRTREAEEFSDRTNEKGEYIYVQKFIDRRVKSNRHLIFGQKGREFWFGGRRHVEHSDLDKVWAEIESNS